MNTAIITFNGFRETPRQQTGTERMWQKLRGFASAGVFVHPPVKWTHDPDEIVGLLRRQGIERVVIVAYSWGAGYGAMRLAKACGEVGIRLPLMLLCDPVYRANWMPTWVGTLPLAIRSIMPATAKIKIPRNVRRVAGVRQTISIPQAHGLKEDGDFTVIEPLQILNYGHTAIDDAPEWHQLVIDKITDLLKA